MWDLIQKQKRNEQTEQKLPDMEKEIGVHQRVRGLGEMGEGSPCMMMDCKQPFSGISYIVYGNM